MFRAESTLAQPAPHSVNSSLLPLRFSALNALESALPQNQISHSANPIESTPFFQIAQLRTKSASVTPASTTLTKHAPRNPIRMNTCTKHHGAPHPTSTLTGLYSTVYADSSALLRRFQPCALLAPMPHAEQLYGHNHRGNKVRHRHARPHQRRRALLVFQGGNGEVSRQSEIDGIHQPVGENQKRGENVARDGRQKKIQQQPPSGTSVPQIFQTNRRTSSAQSSGDRIPCTGIPDNRLNDTRISRHRTPYRVRPGAARPRLDHRPPEQKSCKQETAMFHDVPRFRLQSQRERRRNMPADQRSSRSNPAHRRVRKETPNTLQRCPAQNRPENRLHKFARQAMQQRHQWLAQQDQRRRNGHQQQMLNHVHGK